MPCKSLICLALSASLASAKLTNAPWFYPQGNRPLIVGHRGSLGHFPEHTLAGYTDAWLLGVDWVELDLNVTADGILIANHDQCLMESTDAMLYDSLWSDRRKTVVLPSGHTCTRDFMIPDFDLGELRMLKRR